jgi:hypothetical protein
MTKKKCYELAEKLGAKIHDDDTSIGLEAPRFMTVAPDQHEWRYDVTDSRAGVWADLWEDLKFGFEECDLHKIGECDWCDEVLVDQVVKLGASVILNND